MQVAILAKMAEMANNRQIVDNISNEMAKSVPFGSGNFGENGVFGEDGRNGKQSPNRSQKFK